jgi:hypothetical protein
MTFGMKSISSTRGSAALYRRNADARHENGNCKAFIRQPSQLTPPHQTEQSRSTLDFVPRGKLYCLMS